MTQMADAGHDYLLGGVARIGTRSDTVVATS